MEQTRSGPCSPPHENEFVSGYPASICNIVPGRKYLCCNCNNVLKKAQQTLCGHRYCAPCLAWIVRHGESSLCPKCAEEPSALTEDSYLTEDKAFSDTAINKEISELGVHCVIPGCSWSGVLSEYEDHHRGCDFGAVRCHLGCGAMPQRRALTAHLDGDCPANSSLCPRCSQRISRNQIPKHNCEQMSKDPTARKSDIPAKGQNPQSPADCRFTPLGCTYKGSRDRMKDHEKSSAAAHMSLVLPLLLRIQSSPLAENGFGDYKPAGIHNGEPGKEGIATDCGHHNGGVPAPDVISQICVMESRIQVAENIISVMSREVESFSAKVTAVLEERDAGQRKLRVCEAKITDLRCTVAKKEAEINELHAHLATLEQTTYDGIFLWKINDFTRKCQDASVGRTASLYSPAFYTARYGYKVCLRIYLNGDGAGRGTHISLFFAIMRGEHDVLLSWPFKHKVTFMLLDQSNREHLIDAFRPDAFSASFQRPVNDMNIASGCPLFCPLSRLQSGRSAYVKDDTMFIRCIIDTSE
ncbi:TNF receptor-associated factor 2-like isoform X1 [Bufo gargarizans]|uniref:TNF receptor-associated factor 2-like isoform X1 n=1 Tax=Bufo gargarizans TaxID=30331 RepID=UPI001CF0D6AE|nr:TNF receptor-associated factor 2-like isoform X1 [Bufo gargarizans]